MARLINGVVSVRTPRTSLYRAEDWRQEGGAVTVTFDIAKRTEYLLRLRINSIVEETGTQPSPSKISRMRKEIRTDLEEVYGEQ